MLNPSPIRTMPWIRCILKSNKCWVLASLNEVLLSNRPFLRFMTKGLKSVKWRSEKETFQDHTRESIQIVLVTSSPKKAWRSLTLICKYPVETFVYKHEINILTIKFQWLCKERRVTKYIQISWKGRNFTFNAHVLKLPEPNRNNQYSNQKFLNSNNFPDSKISTSTRIRIHSRTQDSSGNMGNRAFFVKRAKFASWPFTVKNWARSCYAMG